MQNLVLAATRYPQLAALLGYGAPATLSYLHGRNRGAADPSSSGLGFLGYPLLTAGAGALTGGLTAGPPGALAGALAGANIGNVAGLTYGAGHHHGRHNTIEQLMAQNPGAVQRIVQGQNYKGLYS